MRKNIHVTDSDLVILKELAEKYNLNDSALYRAGILGLKDNPPSVVVTRGRSFQTPFVEPKKLPTTPEVKGPVDWGTFCPIHTYTKILGCKCHEAGKVNII